MELVELSARKLLLELVEFGERPPDPDLPKPTSIITAQRKKKSPELLDNRKEISDCKSSKNIEMKPGDWVCTGCNFMNFARNVECLKCKAERPSGASIGGVEMKKGDWNCSKCNYINFARNVECLKCNAARPRSTFTGGNEMKKGDWNCSKCSGLNYAKNKECYHCQPRELKPGDWGCPHCDFLNFSRNSVCKRCNSDRPQRSGGGQDNNEHTWKKPYQFL